MGPERLKFMLPALAYYFTTGPWRNQWVRFGYDPRTDPTAAMYQTLDYRVRLQGGARHQVAAKRSYANYLLPYKAMNWSKPKTSVIQKTSFPGCEPGKGGAGGGVEEGQEEEQQKMKDVYLFREGRIPPYRQMFYQYGDLQVALAQELLASSSRLDRCDEKSGWFPSGTEERLRDLLTQNINNRISADRMEVEDQEQRTDSSQEEEEESEMD